MAKPKAGSRAPIWMRPAPGTRQPKLTRERIAEVALALADAEGFEEVSMRRIATELEVGTMTLYYYVKTKDDLIALMDDAIASAIVIPAEELPKTWRAAILRIAEVEGGGLEAGFAPVDLSALAEDVADSFRPALTDSGHKLAWEIAPATEVRGNRELLAQAIANLLDNARVHTPPGTSVTLSLATAGDRVRLTVADEGPGVSDADRHAILRRFYRAEASRTTPGNGLGLSLVAAVVAAHGGEVVVDSCAPGLKVSIDLPRIK